MPAQGLVGVVALLLLAWLLSEDRRGALAGAQRRLILAGLLLLFGLALLLLKVPPVRDALLSLNAVVNALDRATAAGTSFVFGFIGGAPAPMELKPHQSTAVLAFRYLPLILVISALSAVLFHWRIMQTVVRGFSWALQKTLGIGGALGVASAANVFVGMVEAPILIGPYMKRVSRGELFAIMTVGLGTVAGTVMVLYASFLGQTVEGALGHILVASFLNVPASLVIAALMVPYATTKTEGDFDPERTSSSTMDAVTRGTADGIMLLINVVAMLLVLVALVELANIILSALPDVAGKPIKLERFFGWIFAPLAYAIGIPWEEAAAGGQLLGTKTILNELVAYIDLANAENASLSPKTKLILVYALCGFANLGSLGIMIGGMATLTPERRAEIVALGPRSVLAGLMTTCLTAAVVGLLL
jgi:concentrative nucleoside transporter, CNT family